MNLEYSIISKFRTLNNQKKLSWGHIGFVCGVQVWDQADCPAYEKYIPFGIKILATPHTPFLTQKTLSDHQSKVFRGGLRITFLIWYLNLAYSVAQKQMSNKWSKFFVNFDLQRYHWWKFVNLLTDHAYEKKFFISSIDSNDTPTAIFHANNELNILGGWKSTIYNNSLLYQKLLLATNNVCVIK